MIKCLSIIYLADQVVRVLGVEPRLKGSKPNWLPHASYPDIRQQRVVDRVSSKDNDHTAVVNLAEDRGLEPLGRFHPTHFKCAAIAALPIFQSLRRITLLSLCQVAAARTDLNPRVGPCSSGGDGEIRTLNSLAALYGLNVATLPVCPRPQILVGLRCITDVLGPLSSPVSV